MSRGKEEGEREGAGEEERERCFLQDIHFRFKDIYRLKVKRWKKIFCENENQKKARVAILIPDKID